MTLGVPEDYCLLVNSASQGVQLMPVWREGVEERTRAEWLIENGCDWRSQETQFEKAEVSLFSVVCSMECQSTPALLAVCDCTFSS